MQPEIDILGLSLKTFGMCFGLAFVVSGAVVGRRLQGARQARRTGPTRWSSRRSSAGCVGARLYWILANLDDVRGDVLGGIFGGSGSSGSAAALGGAAGVLLWARRRGMFNLDAARPARRRSRSGYAVGRIGCQISGDGDYGRPTDLPWGMAYPDGVVPTTDVVHPTPIYETLSMVPRRAGRCGARATSLRPGVLFACYLVLAGAERFLVEFVRRNDARRRRADRGAAAEPRDDAGRAAIWLWRRRAPAGWRRADAHAASRRSPRPA